ncbi:hypothetical protein MANES_11G069700v8 [Manihot esculenta]|uniref:Uncharacterized protein n=1 Tax=Manihot esculenta TaxID=3983 RepID=A0ACB7GTW6_MANES|nr:hypothetical protein MANES_11G069700v8 [Manihot esculenta]
MYYLINKSPWSSLDENKPFLTTADSAIKLLPEATKPVTGWNGLEYKAAFPMLKPPGANFYPPDMDKMEFELWKGSLTESKKHDATSFFTVIKRQSEFDFDSSLPNHTVDGRDYSTGVHDLFSIPYCKEYNSLITRAANLLQKAGDLAGSPSLKRLLHGKAAAFLSNDYYDSDIAWMELVWYSNPALRDWLKEHADASELDNLKWMYYLINKSPWSSLDENKPFLTTADSAIKLLPEATKPVTGWNGLEYKAAFPMLKPPGANFYPPDMDKMEFELWKGSLTESKKHDATSFFTVIKRQSEFDFDSSLPNHTVDGRDYSTGVHDLFSIPYCKEYNSLITRAANLLQKAGDLAGSPSLKRLLHGKAAAFLSNDYYDSDIAWMELDSKLDVTIGPYETYEDALFGYKATFEAFIGVRDDEATAQLKLFGNNLQVLEQHLPMDDIYKSTNVNSAPIRVIKLIYNAGDVKGPQTIAFNLPNDERIVKERGTSMVMLKNVSEAKFKHILQPIADVCIAKEQKELVDFESFFTHTICHECCHGIGPHTITLPNGQKSTVREELQELHSALEEAKADIVGLWALNFLINQDLLPKSLEKSMYVSFLTGCFRSVRFGLEEAHGKGQAVQFNWLFEKEAFVLHPDETFSVDFAKVEGAVESLSREILTIQAKGDKGAASLLLQKYCKMTQPLKLALLKLESIQVPVDIAPTFTFADETLG